MAQTSFTDIDFLSKLIGLILLVSGVFSSLINAYFIKPIKHEQDEYKKDLTNYGSKLDKFESRVDAITTGVNTNREDVRRLQDSAKGFIKSNATEHGDFDRLVEATIESNADLAARLIKAEKDIVAIRQTFRLKGIADIPENP
jgi:ABC-type transporter Mla subunit MlaD